MVEHVQLLRWLRSIWLANPLTPTHTTPSHANVYAIVYIYIYATWSNYEPTSEPLALSKYQETTWNKKNSLGHGLKTNVLKCGQGMRSPIIS